MCARRAGTCEGGHTDSPRDLDRVVLPAQVKIMKDFDPTGKRGPKTPLPDVVKVIEPKVSSLRGGWVA